VEIDGFYEDEYRDRSRPSRNRPPISGVEIGGRFYGGHVSVPMFAWLIVEKNYLRNNIQSLPAILLLPWILCGDEKKQIVCKQSFFFFESAVLEHLKNFHT